MLGRATILLMISQGAFLVSGYAVNVGLARLLGPADFGTFGVVMSLLLVVQLFVITGIPIALQKYVAENVDASRLLLRKTLPWHLIYSFAVFGLCYAAAPLVAKLLKDQSLAFYLQIASFDIIFYGLYKYYLSMQNGLHQFGRQTMTGIAYAAAKPLAIFVLIYLGYGITGAVVGNMIGSIGGLLAGVLIIRFPEIKSKLGDIPFFRFAFTNVFYFVGLQLLFSIDIWFVKYYQSDAVVGEYISASSMAKIPYFLSLAVSSALLPTISRASKENDEKRVQDIVRIAMRYWLMLLAALIVVVSSTSTSIVVLFFGAAYAQAGAILAVLFAAIAFLTFAAVMNTILISRGQLPACLKVVGSLIILDVLANAWLVPRFGSIGAAYATLAASCMAIVLSSYFLLREMRVIMPVVSAVRTVVAGAAVLAAAFYFPVFDSYLILKCGALLLGFVAILFLLKELNVADIKRLRAVVVQTND